MLVACPFQFVFDVASIYLTKLKPLKESAKQSCLFLAFQVFMVLVFVYVVCQSIYFIQMTIEAGRYSLIFLTFLFAALLSYALQAVVLLMVYTVVVRRFGFLQSNEKDYIDKANLELKTENQMPKLKQLILKMLEHRVFETFSMILISLYTAFILFDLTLSEVFNFDPNVMAKIDSVFLTIFAVEIFLKTFASNGMYLADFFNAFDATIVGVSEILNIVGIIAKGLGVLRLIRVVVITIRKITGNTSKLRHQAKNNNPVDSVIKILQ